MANDAIVFALVNPTPLPTDELLGEYNVLSVFNRDVARSVARAVAQAAMPRASLGVGTPSSRRLSRGRTFRRVARPVPPPARLRYRPGLPIR